ncbi:MAG: hypothetical protein MK078_15140 [Crocinitomicaceae bacterium]|nr:hypothetical protein [Crocinitomicaceae bacterium]
MKNLIFPITLGLLLMGCSDDDPKGKTETSKGFQVREISENEEGEKELGVALDTLNIESRPSTVLKTAHPNHRLVPVYMVNYNKKTKQPYIGNNNFIWTWYEDDLEGNFWVNYMPGLEAMQGYNMINVSHFNNETKTENKLFRRPVLIRTVYYPAFSNDTLASTPVTRNYYMVSVYDDDTNEDGYINFMDLRRFYYFDIEGKNQQRLIPKEYAVMSSEYDWVNDYMYVYTRKDTNENGQMESTEPTTIFWIDLKDPLNNGIQYSPEYN